MEHRMTLKRFQDILDIYGADSTRWPLDDRAEAVAFLKADPAARDAFEDARALDVLLTQTSECPPAPLDLCDRIMASLPPLPESTAEHNAIFSEPGSVRTEPVAEVFSFAPARAAAVKAPFLPKQKRPWTLPVAALAASLVLGILSGAVVKNRLPVAAQPSLDQVFSIGFAAQLAFVPKGQGSLEDVQ